MKKLFLFLSIVCIISTSFTTEGEKARKVFSSISERYGVTFSMSYAKDHINAIDTDIDMNGVKNYLQGDFHQIKLQVLDAKSTADIKKLFTKNGYSELHLDKKDVEGDIHLLLDRKGRFIKEAHMLIGSDKNVVLMSFFGDLEVKKEK